MIDHGWGGLFNQTETETENNGAENGFNLHYS